MNAASGHASFEHPITARRLARAAPGSVNRTTGNSLISHGGSRRSGDLTWIVSGAVRETRIFAVPWCSLNHPSTTVPIAVGVTSTRRRSTRAWPSAGVAESMTIGIRLNPARCKAESRHRLPRLRRSLVKCGAREWLQGTPVGVGAEGGQGFALIMG
jgi:hypothetical protein